MSPRRRRENTARPVYTQTFNWRVVMKEINNEIRAMDNAGIINIITQDDELVNDYFFDIAFSYKDDIYMLWKDEEYDDEIPCIYINQLDIHTDEIIASHSFKHWDYVDMIDDVYKWLDSNIY